jgi:hypothetical protein
VTCVSVSMSDILPPLEFCVCTDILADRIASQTFLERGQSLKKFGNKKLEIHSTTSISVLSEGQNVRAKVNTILREKRNKKVHARQKRMRDDHIKSECVRHTNIAKALFIQLKKKLDWDDWTESAVVGRLSNREFKRIVESKKKVLKKLARMIKSINSLESAKKAIARLERENCWIDKVAARIWNCYADSYGKYHFDEKDEEDSFEEMMLRSKQEIVSMRRQRL